MKTNILITGLPKSGKSTLLKGVVSRLDNKIGFITNEIREDSERVGFEIETCRGDRFLLAHIDIETDFKVSKYFVDVKNLNLSIPNVSCFQDGDILYLDEIGQMELFSRDFKELALSYLDSPNICLATLSKVYEDDFIERIRKREDIILVEISEENQENFVNELVRKIGKAKRYLLDPSRFSIKGDQASIRSDHDVRNLKKMESGWRCDCEFFQSRGICSHVIALEEHMRIN